MDAVEPTSSFHYKLFSKPIHQTRIRVSLLIMRKRLYAEIIYKIWWPKKLIFIFAIQPSGFCYRILKKLSLNNLTYHEGVLEDGLLQLLCSYPSVLLPALLTYLSSLSETFWRFSLYYELI